MTTGACSEQVWVPARSSLQNQMCFAPQTLVQSSVLRATNHLQQWGCWLCAANPCQRSAAPRDAACSILIPSVWGLCCWAALAPVALWGLQKRWCPVEMRAARQNGLCSMQAVHPSREAFPWDGSTDEGFPLGSAGGQGKELQPSTLQPPGQVGSSPAWGACGSAGRPVLALTLPPLKACSAHSAVGGRRSP